jgi:hypothetical protein
MSHFTVLVIGPNPEEQLLPFDENTKDPRYIEYKDTEDEYLKEYNEKTVETVIIPETGKRVTIYCDEYRGKHKGKLPISFTPMKELHPTFEEFVKEWHGVDEREHNNRYGYFRNPNGKWDWYGLGGRWTGFFTLKPNTPGTVGEPGLCTEKADKGFADMAYKKDIDFDSMRRKAANKARHWYTMVQEEFRGNIPKLDIHWEELRDENNEKYKDIPRDKIRDTYHGQSAMQLWKAAADRCRKSKDKDDDSKMLYEIFMWGDLEKFQCTEEEYVKKAYDSATSTFAVIKDGKWYEKGKMGFWAMVANEKADWNEEFTKLLDSVPDDTLISIYDCHV